MYINALSGRMRRKVDLLWDRKREAEKIINPENLLLITRILWPVTGSLELFYYISI